MSDEYSALQEFVNRGLRAQKAVDEVIEKALVSVAEGTDNPFTETMAAAYVASILNHDMDRSSSLITGLRGVVDEGRVTNQLQIQIVGEWLTVTVEVTE